MASFRLCLPRMRRLTEATRGWWVDIRRRNQHLYGPVLDRIRAEGPLAASAFRDPDGPRRGSWWDWAPAKHVLEDLFDCGTLLVHDRVNFERRYDLAERVLPPGTRHLRADRGRGRGRADPAGRPRPRGRDRRRPGRLLPAAARRGQGRPGRAGRRRAAPGRSPCEGWAKPAYLLPGTRVPRRVAHPPVLLSPFDSLIWSRERTERLFGFRYRLEVYVPAGKRVHGYYMMPVLADGRLVARVDPKHDRQADRLLLRALHLEPSADPAEAVAATAAAATRLAAHLGAGRVEAGDAMPAALAAVAPRYPAHLRNRAPKGASG